MLGLVVVKNSLGGRQDQIAELSRRKDIGRPSLEVVEGNVEAGRDDSALVDSAEELDDDFTGAVIVNDFELADVPSLLHKLQKLDEDFGAGTKKHLVRRPVVYPCVLR